MPSYIITIIRLRSKNQIHRRRTNNDCQHCKNNYTLTNHGKDFYTQNSAKHHRWINLTNPKFSKVLNAPLAKSAGGLGTCKTKTQFKDPSDKDYQLMLAAIQQGKNQLYAKPRMDMPGSNPIPYPQNFAGPFTGFAGP